MAHRYVPRTYNNRRVLRVVTGVAITVILTIALLFMILFFVFQRYVVDGQLQIPWLSEEFPVIEKPPEEPTEKPTLPTEPATDSLGESDDTDGSEAATDSNDSGNMDDDTAPDDDGDSGTAPAPDTYTLAQIEKALQPQFAVSAFGERNPEVISVKEVERDRDTIRLESSDPNSLPIDLTNSKRYRVEFAFDQPYNEFMIWEELNRNEESKPYRRDGDRTIMTDHYYFNDETGTPVLAFIRK